MVVGVFDLLTLGVGIAGYALGRSRGLAWQVSGLLTLIVGGLSATVLSRPLGPLFSGGVAGRFAAWVVVYVVVATCLYVLTLKLKHKLKELEYEELDQRFGALLGAAKALGVFAVLTLVAVALSARVESTVKASLAGQALRAIVREARPLLPDRIHESFGPWLDRVDEPAPPASPPRWPTNAPAAPAPPQGARPTAPTPQAPASPPPTPPQQPPRASAPRPTAPSAAPSTAPQAPGPVASPPPTTPRPRRHDDARDLPASHERGAADLDPEAPAADPFDTSRDPVDPLAPPR